MLPPYIEKQEREEQEDNRPNPTETRLFCGIGGRLPRSRMRNRQRLIHCLLLFVCPLRTLGLINTFSHIRNGSDCTKYHSSRRLAGSQKANAQVRSSLRFSAEQRPAGVKKWHKPTLHASACHLMDEQRRRIVARFEQSDFGRQVEVLPELARAHANVSVIVPRVFAGLFWPAWDEKCRKPRPWPRGSR